MLASYHAVPTKPEKSTKIDHVQDRGKKEISNVEKKDRGNSEKPKERKTH